MEEQVKRRPSLSIASSSSKKFTSLSPVRHSAFLSYSIPGREAFRGQDRAF